MSRFAPRFQSPLHQAAWSTAVMVLFGLAVRFVGGAYVSEMRTWTFVAIAPLLGFVTYLQRTGRNRQLAFATIGLGIGGLLFWMLALISGRIPITGRMDYVFMAVVFAFPVAALALGWMQLREPPRNASQHPKP